MNFVIDYHSYTHNLSSCLNMYIHPKCQVEVVAYESLDHNGSKFFLLGIIMPMLMQSFIRVKVNFEKKSDSSL